MRTGNEPRHTILKKSNSHAHLAGVMEESSIAGPEFEPNNDIQQNQADKSISSSSTVASILPSSLAASKSRRDTTETQRMMATETKCVRWGRTTMLACMLFAAVLVCTGAYLILQDEDADDFSAAVSERPFFEYLSTQLHHML
jgi:hypothetical protein